MVKIEFKNVVKIFGKKEKSKTVINDMSFEVSHGDFFGIIGSSGSGKTTVLRMIAGLENPTHGTISFDDHAVSSNGKILVPVEDRNIGMVFQNWALYPHMTNFENIAFPLRAKRVPHEEVKRKVEYLAELLNIKEALNQRPGTISGGQQQRVSVCRALAKDPSLLLLDEPFSNLDATIKDSARSLVRKVQKDLGITAIIVSHDPADIFAFAPRTLCITNGTNGQTDNTTDLYHKPNTIDVAKSIGEINLLMTRIEPSGGSYAAMIGDESKLQLEKDELRLNAGNGSAGSIILGIRPEDIRIAQAPGLAAGEAVDWIKLCPATVKISSYSSGIFRILMQIKGVEADVATTSEMPLPPGQAVHIYVRRHEIKFFDAQGNNVKRYGN